MLNPPSESGFRRGYPFVELPSVVHHYLEPELSELKSTLNQTIDPCDDVEFFGESLTMLKRQISRARLRASNEPADVSVRAGIEVSPTGVRREIVLVVPKDQLERTLDEILRIIGLAEERNLAVLALGD